MEFLYDPEFINIIWIGAAFVFGFAVSEIGLPPMVGFLAAGFALNFAGLTGGSLALNTIADVGVMLLLFIVGLKLDLRSLARREVWAGTSLTMLFSVLFFGAVIMTATALGLTFFSTLDIYQAGLIGFALGFSSTIFAIKVLEEKGELNAEHAHLAIGVLIMQDILAVVFITASKGAFPSLWALAVPVVLFALRPVLMFLIDRIGHGEMLTLGGLFIAIVIGATGFDIVGLKADLGALIMGVLVGSHPRASELGKALYSFKDMFLVGFFFQIGLVALPDMNHIIPALLFLLLLPVKSVLYYLVFSLFRLGARTSFMATLSLSNYSEFGLIVAAIAGKNGWLSADWLLILSLALTFSFIVSSPLNAHAGSLFQRCSRFLNRFTPDMPEDVVESPRKEIFGLVAGMGRIGLYAYENMRVRFGNDSVMGLDHDDLLVQEMQKEGKNVLQGDVSDSQLWKSLDLDSVSIIMLAVPHINASVTAVRELRDLGYPGTITAIAKFDDEAEALTEAGVTYVYNIYAEAGAGYAMQVCKALKEQGVGCSAG